MAWGSQASCVEAAPVYCSELTGNLHICILARPKAGFLQNLEKCWKFPITPICTNFKLQVIMPSSRLSCLPPALSLPCPSKLCGASLPFIANSGCMPPEDTWNVGLLPQLCCKLRSLLGITFLLLLCCWLLKAFSVFLWIACNKGHFGEPMS